MSFSLCQKAGDGAHILCSPIAYCSIVWEHLWATQQHCKEKVLKMRNEKKGSSWITAKLDRKEQKRWPRKIHDFLDFSYNHWCLKWSHCNKQAWIPDSLHQNMVQCNYKRRDPGLGGLLKGCTRKVPVNYMNMFWKFALHLCIGLSKN